MPSPPFRCKKFLVNQEGAAFALGTDSVLIGAWAAIGTARSVLDIGTGTGIIALMLAQRIADNSTAPFSVTGIDIHSGSAACAARNFADSPWASSLWAEAIRVQDLSTLLPCPTFDLIVSNPPYFTETILAPDLARRNARSTDTLPISDLVDAVEKMLSPDGRFCLILPVTEGERFYQFAATKGLYLNRKTVVFSKKSKPAERLLLELSRNPIVFERDDLVLFEEDGERTGVFSALAAGFYLAMRN